MWHDKTPDSEIITALQRGDQKALECVFQRYWKKLYYVALRKTNSHELAEEIVQDLFTDLWDKRNTLFVNYQLEEFNLSAYLMTSVKNKVLNLVRSQVYAKEYYDYYKGAFSHIANSTEHQVEFDGLTNALEEGIKKLPKKSQQVFQLNRLEGRSISEIATRLNLSEKAIEYHLTKSLKIIRFYLKDYTVPSLFVLFMFC